MKKTNPLTSLKIVLAIVGISVVVLPIVSLLEGKKTEAFPCLLFIFVCSIMILTVLTWLDKRLSTLEKKLHDSNEPNQK